MKGPLENTTGKKNLRIKFIKYKHLKYIKLKQSKPQNFAEIT